jgi:hypothetical protein
MPPNQHNASVRLESHSIGIALDPESKPVCLILSYDTLEMCAEIAFRGRTAQIDEGDLLIHSPVGSMRMVNVGQAVIDAGELKLPIVVLDPQNERETQIDVWVS